MKLLIPTWIVAGLISTYSYLDNPYITKIERSRMDLIGITLLMTSTAPISLTLNTLHIFYHKLEMDKCALNCEVNK